MQTRTKEGTRREIGLNPAVGRTRPTSSHEKMRGPGLRSFALSAILGVAALTLSIGRPAAAASDVYLCGHDPQQYFLYRDTSTNDWNTVSAWWFESALFSGDQGRDNSSLIGSGANLVGIVITQGNSFILFSKAGLFSISYAGIDSNGDECYEFALLRTLSNSTSTSGGAATGSGDTQAQQVHCLLNMAACNGQAMPNMFGSMLINSASSNVSGLGS